MPTDPVRTWWQSYRRCPHCRGFLQASDGNKFYCLWCGYREGIEEEPYYFKKHDFIPEAPGYHV